MNNEIRKTLLTMQDETYRAFAASLCPSTVPFLGVRLPELRKMAKAIAKEDWRAYLSHASLDTFEEIMLQGMVIGYVEGSLDEVLPYIEKFVPLIENWSVCDSFCSGLKIVRRNQADFWPILEQYFNSQNEFELRFAFVMALHYYMDESYFDLIFCHAERVRHDGYYVKMAIAWALSVCYVKAPRATHDFLRKNTLSDFTHNKTIQKIIESRRVDQETKDLLRAIKRRL